MRDGPFRSTIKRLALGVYDLRLSLHRGRARARGEVPYELGGSCVLCAKCCEAPGIQVGFVTWHFPLVRRLFLEWHRRVNGFELVSRSRRDRAFIFRCTHFDPASRRCDSYETRPGMCRDYPRPLLEQADPEFFDGCGYRPRARGREVLLQILERHTLTAAQSAKLKKDLYLED